jgi:hypothetical protein
MEVANAVMTIVERIPPHDLTLIVVIVLFLRFVRSEKKRKSEDDE